MIYPFVYDYFSHSGGTGTIAAAGESCIRVTFGDMFLAGELDTWYRLHAPRNDEWLKENQERNKITKWKYDPVKLRQLILTNRHHITLLLLNVSGHLEIISHIAYFSQCISMRLFTTHSESGTSKTKK